jgi:hypothetical protein
MILVELLTITVYTFFSYRAYIAYINFRLSVFFLKLIPVKCALNHDFLFYRIKYRCFIHEYMTDSGDDIFVDSFEQELQ